MIETEFEFQPTLLGKLIKVRPLYVGDFEELYLCASNPKVWEQHPQSDRYKREVFQKFFEGAIDSQGAFAIVELKTDRIIGSSRFYDFNKQKKQVNIGYTFLKTECWGGKYNRELKTLMLAHAFRFVDLVRFEIGANNLRSRRAIEKIGAQLIDNEILDDKPHVIYGILKEKFLNSEHL